MGAGIPLSKGTWIGSQNPNDAKYFNDTQPYSNVAEVLSLIPISERHIGLTVNVDKVEYTFKDGIEDADLVINQPEAPNFSETVLVPIQNLDEQEVDLVINNYDNVFRLNTFSDATDLKISIPLGSENFMCYIHIVHKGNGSKQVTFLNSSIAKFLNNTLNTVSPTFTISSNPSSTSFSYIALSMYVHKINGFWNLDYKYNVELTREFDV